MTIYQLDALVNIVYDALIQDMFLRNRKPLMMMGYGLVMFFILTSSMVIQLTLTSLFAVLLSHLLSPPLLLVLGCWNGCQG